MTEGAGYDDGGAEVLPLTGRWGPDDWMGVLVATFQAGRQLRRIVAKYTHACRVTDAEFLLLWICGQHAPQGIPQSELVARLGMSPAQLSGLVYDVRDRGWIEMQRPVADRRRQVVRITSLGSEMLARVMRELAPLVGELEQLVSADERQTCRQFLSHLIAIDGMESLGVARAA